MDKERRDRIEAALEQYREIVLQHNLSILRLLVEAVEKLPTPPNCSVRLGQKLRLKEIERELRGSAPESVESPRDLLNDDLRAWLTERYDLDGVCHLPVNLELREEYFAGVRASMAVMNVEVAEFPPADLEYLCTLVSGITGPGLPLHRLVQQFAFISSIEENDLSNMMKAVVVCNRENDEVKGWSSIDDPEGLGLFFEFIWEDWDISVAFEIGASEELGSGGAYALYCRKGNNEGRQWRYGIHDGDWHSDLFDSVEEFLVFYAHFNEQTEERFRRDFNKRKGTTI